MCKKVTDAVNQLEMFADLAPTDAVIKEINEYKETCYALRFEDYKNYLPLTFNDYRREISSDLSQEEIDFYVWDRDRQYKESKLLCF